jgi:hypothetical protein
MKIVRIWIYKITEELMQPDCKFSETNKYKQKVVRGDFEYYKIENETVERCNRRDADEWAKLTGQEVETRKGYPAFMHDQGYRA